MGNPDPVVFYYSSMSVKNTEDDDCLLNLENVNCQFSLNNAFGITSSSLLFSKELRVRDFALHYMLVDFSFLNLCNYCLLTFLPVCTNWFRIAAGT